MAPNGVFKSTEVNNEVNFTINGTLYKVDSNVPSDTSLNTFIRNHAHLTGTKAMCHEGGCGSCIVTVTSKDPITRESRTYAVNSCLVNVFSCQGWAVTTIEGIGNRKTGYHPVQARLAQFNGTQCGYCSPGMVMNMHSLLESKEVTMKEVENSFGGNICRCTGYRPILDAFKSFSTDATEELKKKVADIEDLHKVKICPKTGKDCKGTCDDNDELIITQANTPIHIEFGGVQWYKTTALDEVFKIFDQIGDRVYRLVAGNTGQGVYRITNDPQVLIDIGNIPELKVISTEPTLKLGGGVTMTDAMNYFYKLATENPKYKYTKVLADHIDLVANVPVRNTGTIAGNLQMKNDHPEFPSDIFLMLETVGATINIAEGVGKIVNMSLLSFLDIDMKHKIIHSIVLPELDQNFNVRTFKIMPRAQNAHAYVNAGFLFKMKMNDNGKVLAKPTIVFGGISPEFVHAQSTESYLTGKNLFDRKVMRTALKIMDTELETDLVLPDASPAYRKGLAESLFYKFILGLSPQDLPDSLKSGGTIMSRPVSTAKQDYETNDSVWPLNKPIPKIEAVAQCSGEAQYVGDLPAQPGELHGAFVLTTVAQGFIANIDPSEALSVPGVVSFISAKDIPGKNSFAVTELIGMTEDEEVFCSGAVKYAGQPVGLIVATSQRLALKATHKVKIEYSGVTRPQIDMREVIKSGDQSRIKVEVPAKEIKIPDNPAHVVKGRFGVGGQYHYTMETQSCVVVPIEDGLEVYPTAQWMDLAQVAISRVLNIPENRINVVVRRLGGGYGAKISRNSLISAACALAAHLLNKPVRIVMNLETNMEALGKRYDATMDYEVGTDEKGKILYLKGEVYENCGHSWNEQVVGLTTHHMNYACYDSSNWSLQGFSVKTDVASNTYCRAPSSTEGIAMVENIMEHIAKELKLDPVQVRLNNFPSKEIGRLVEDLKVTAEYDARKESVEAFNKEQRWKKRGIALVPMIYGFSFWGNFSAIVSIYAQDGTVAVSHGGIEMGQGLNTKVAQVVAHTLDIPLEFVSVKPSNNLTSPNGMVSGGSITSEVCSYAAMVCCKELLKRMEPIKKDLKDASWPQLTKASYDKGVDLCATHMFTTKDNLKDYNIYGVTICEVEVDLLTGQHQILRVDLLEDAGVSLSPDVDIGQVEGAFIMGLGYYTMEQLTYSPDNGRLLTNRTWNYKPPGVKDIPIDFRVYLRKNAPNPFGVLRSKATGEPPLCMSCVILLALRNAIDAARKDAGNTDAWYEMDAPYTAERLFLSSLTNVDLFSL